MSHVNLPVIQVEGRTFIRADLECNERLCTGCVADEAGNGHLCCKLPACIGRDADDEKFTIIFKEIA